MNARERPVEIERDIALGPDLPPVPERLLLAHARGEVLFICGAGVSQPAGLPLFKGLTGVVSHFISRSFPEFFRATNSYQSHATPAAVNSDVGTLVGSHDARQVGDREAELLCGC